MIKDQSRVLYCMSGLLWLLWPIIVFSGYTNFVSLLLWVWHISHDFIGTCHMTTLLSSLLKAHAMEARLIVRQALNILTPVVPVRMEDTNATLVHWTKKIIVEEGHSVAQLIHML